MNFGSDEGDKVIGLDLSLPIKASDGQIFPAAWSVFRP